MNITVFGASGGTGQQVVQQALDSGHQVTAIVRDPARLPLSHQNLDVVTADVSDSVALLPALDGSDVAISALAASKKAGLIATRAVRSILAAMSAAGVRRFLAVSATPVGPHPEGESFLGRTVVMPLVGAIFRDVYADLADMEAEIELRGAEWTIVRPPRLLDRPARGTYRTVIGGNVPRGRLISRADLAHAMLALVHDQSSVRKAVGVAY